MTSSVAENEAFVAMLRDINCTYVRIAPTGLEQETRIIVTFDQIGAKSVADHFADLGHRRIGFIAGRKNFLSAKERYDGFKAGLEDRGLSLEGHYVAQGDFTFASGLEAAKTLLCQPSRPTAIFAANDEMAAGALLAIRLAGLRTPDDVSVVGFDNFHIAETVWPRLTTVNAPTFKVGQVAAKALLNDTDDIDRYVVGKPTLVIRESSAAPK